MSKHHIKEENRTQAEAFHRMKGDESKTIERYAADFSRIINEFIRTNGNEQTGD